MAAALAEADSVKVVGRPTTWATRVDSGGKGLVVVVVFVDGGENSAAVSRRVEGGCACCGLLL